MKDIGLPDFSDKVVIFYVQNAPSSCKDGIMLECISFEKREERIFMTGRSPPVSDNDWSTNCKSVLAWDTVFHYLEFKNLKDYQDRTSQYKPTFMERLRW